MVSAGREADGAGAVHGEAVAGRDASGEVIRRHHLAQAPLVEVRHRVGDAPWDGTPVVLGRSLWPVARSVKECPGAGDCGWLFYDTSRNGARRWCSMEGCGSGVKMRRHYARQRGGTP